MCPQALLSKNTRTLLGPGPGMQWDTITASMTNCWGICFSVFPGSLAEPMGCNATEGLQVNGCCAVPAESCGAAVQAEQQHSQFGDGSTGCGRTPGFLPAPGSAGSCQCSHADQRQNLTWWSETNPDTQHWETMSLSIIVLRIWVCLSLYGHCSSTRGHQFSFCTLSCQCHSLFSLDFAFSMCTWTFLN